VLVTGWQVRQETAASGLEAGTARREADISAYRDAVTDVLVELAHPSRYLTVETAERILTRRLTEPEFAMVLSAVPQGPDAAMHRVLAEVRNYRQNELSSAGDLAAMIRIALLAQIDLLWWGNLPAYQADEDVFGAEDLFHLEPLRRENMLLFRYRLQTATLLGRAARSAERRAVPARTPSTAGLKFPCARAELIVLLNQIAAEFASLVPRGTPPLWVTSLTRSVQHQRHLRALGYAAVLPSAHCMGYAADIEMTWFRRFQADRTLQSVLLERQRAGEINVIDEGQAWHVCLRPGAGRALRLVPDRSQRLVPDRVLQDVSGPRANG
jgi:hypothetical protein